MSSNSPLPPPPRRTVVPAPPALPYSSAPQEKETWKGWSKRKGAAWGTTAVVKGTLWSDRIGAKVNGYAEGMGSERFWPTTGDGPAEMEKAARILRAFTVDGVERTEEEKAVKGVKKQRKVLKKIPSRIIRDAKGLAIFTSMRTGIAPLGGAGGAGVVVARLEDGSWSAPASISPNNLSAGFMLGCDVYDAVLIIRTDAALQSFYGHKTTLGSEFGIAAGPFGAGAAVELGLEKSPVLSYIRSRGLYAGAEVVVQIFVARGDENAALYNWPGVTPADILTGGVKVPESAAPLVKALQDAESGRAQRMKGIENEWEELLPEIDSQMLALTEGEVLRLPPTPGQMSQEEEAMLEAEEVARIADERDEARRVKLEAEEEADRRFFAKRAEDKSARMEQEQAEENAWEEEREEASARREKEEAEQNAREDAVPEAAKLEESARWEVEAAEERKRLP